MLECPSKRNQHPRRLVGIHTNLRTKFTESSNGRRYSSVEDKSQIAQDGFQIDFTVNMGCMYLSFSAGFPVIFICSVLSSTLGLKSDQQRVKKHLLESLCAPVALYGSGHLSFRSNGKEISWRLRMLHRAPLPHVRELRALIFSRLRESRSRGGFQV